MQAFRSFTHKDARFRISTPAFSPACADIRATRRLLEDYIRCHPEFQTALTPLPDDPEAPPLIRTMLQAALRAGAVGPMAAVAGAVAQSAAEAAQRHGATEVIVENGGDLYLATPHEVQVALFTGPEHPLADRLALRITPDEQPVAICSSSSRMGHSLSFGQCDLATVLSADAALADAAATRACNEVKTPDDLPAILERTAAIPGILGVLLVKDDRIGMQGPRLPELVKNRDANTREKITVHQNALHVPSSYS